METLFKVASICFHDLALVNNNNNKKENSMPFLSFFPFLFARRLKSKLIIYLVLKLKSFLILILLYVYDICKCV